MIDLDLVILRRNARLRAWAAYGVPVEGGWHFRGPGDYWHKLRVWCLACRASGSMQETALDSSDSLEHMLDSERWAWLGVFGCAHLQPLLGEDPPEIAELIKLELLAGS